MSGYWVYVHATDSVGEVWDGTNLTFTSLTRTCSGATLTATMNWASTDGTYAATELYTGTYDSDTRTVTWNGQSITNPHGNVVLDDDTATYDPATDQLLGGSWTGGHPGSFTAHHVTDSGSAPGFDGGADASADAASE
jgi:hypothetical protein